MYTIANRLSVLNQALLDMTAVLQQVAVLVRTAQQAFTVRRDARAQASMTIRELSSLSDRDLRDIGISRGDIPRLAWEQRQGRRIDCDVRA